jgi:hypothetical protein
MGGNTSNLIRVEPVNTRVIACATVLEEMLPIMPPGMQYSILDFGLHIKPDLLKFELQKKIDEEFPGVNTIILGYGLCSQAVVGLRSIHCRLVVPRADDCIALFLGSVEAYKHQHRLAPGTYYLTKGWLKTGGTPFKEYDDFARKYGEIKAKRIMSQILKNYTRLAFINTGESDLDSYHCEAINTARRFDLNYEEIQGSDTLISKTLYGPWDDSFVIAEPGNAISFEDFRKI